MDQGHTKKLDLKITSIKKNGFYLPYRGRFGLEEKNKTTFKVAQRAAKRTLIWIVAQNDRVLDFPPLYIVYYPWDFLFIVVEACSCWIVPLLPWRREESQLGCGVTVLQQIHGRQGHCTQMGDSGLRVLAQESSLSSHALKAPPWGRPEEPSICAWGLVVWGRLMLLCYSKNHFHYSETASLSADCSSHQLKAF